MGREQMIKESEKFVKNYLEDVESGHSWWHIHRVINNARQIYSIEKTGDPFIIHLGALFHDIGDRKIDPETDGPMVVDKFLTGIGLQLEERNRITHIVRYVSFRDSFESCMERTDELNIVQDADRLDAIGAIGIARAFSYGGSKGANIYIPGEDKKSVNSKEEYILSGSSTIGHFYEKLLRLYEMMNTESGYRLAKRRHEFMEKFLEQFYSELDPGIDISSIYTDI